MKKLSHERFQWFHKEVRKKTYPNATTLAGEFEVSRKTGQREIDFFRDRLSVPLEYDNARRGYFYTDDTFELPAIWLKREEIIALLLAKRLASSIPDKSLKSSLGDFLNKLSPFISSDPSFSSKGIEEKISLKNIEYFNVDESRFQEACNALFNESPLNITYYSPHSHKESKRAIFPLHLLNYMGNWHLISWCSLKGEMRDFALSRIRKIDISKDNLTLPEGLPPVKEFMRKQFGIFSGSGEVKVKLRFSPKASRWVKEQVWHKGQETGWDDKERLILKIPVADFREIKREILKFGADVEVLKPKELRVEVKKEIEKMNKIYG